MMKTKKTIAAAASRSHFSQRAVGLMAAVAVVASAWPAAPALAQPAARIVKVGRDGVRPEHEVLRFERHEKNVVITWEIEDAVADHTFDAGDGIDLFEDKGAGRRGRARSEFVNCGVVPGSGNRKYQCTNRNTTPGLYRYNINLRDRNNGRRPIDPIVHNL